VIVDGQADSTAPGVTADMYAKVMAHAPELIEKTGGWLFIFTELFLDWADYGLAAYFLYQFAMIVDRRVMSKWVNAELNQWVVITRGGKMVQAGIGLNCFVTPFDSIAVFPSKLTKVEVQTQQITKEMQGVQVNSMLEWTVDREGLGPMKAYQNLDLGSGNFNNANATLRDLVSAIVRHKIANSTLDEVLKDRDGLRESISHDIEKQAKGWGVHLATVEITDVRILSGSLFTNLQTQFREENNKKATIERLEVEDGIWTQQQEHSLTQTRRDADANKVERLAYMAEQLRMKTLELEKFKQQKTIQRLEVQRNNLNSLENNKRYYKKEIQQSKNQVERKSDQIDLAIKQEVAQREVTATENKNAMKDLKFKLAQVETKAEEARKIKKAGYDLEKELLDDPTQQKLRKMSIVESLYKKMAMGGIKMNIMGSENPVNLIMKQFSALSGTDQDASAVVEKK
jgi:hypothetical protein